MKCCLIKGEYPKGQEQAAKETAGLVQAEPGKLVAIRGGNLARFGDQGLRIPMRPTPLRRQCF
jgi:hypothetical protein